MLLCYIKLISRYKWGFFCYTCTVHAYTYHSTLYQDGNYHKAKLEFKMRLHKLVMFISYVHFIYTVVKGSLKHAEGRTRVHQTAAPLSRGLSRALHRRGIGEVTW